MGFMAFGAGAGAAAVLATFIVFMAFKLLRTKRYFVSGVGAAAFADFIAFWAFAVVKSQGTRRNVRCYGTLDP